MFISLFALGMVCWLLYRQQCAINYQYMVNVRLEGDKEALEERVEDLEAAVDELGDEVSTLKAEIDDLQVELDSSVEEDEDDTVG